MLDKGGTSVTLDKVFFALLGNIQSELSGMKNAPVPQKKSASRRIWLGKSVWMTGPYCVLISEFARPHVALHADLRLSCAGL